MSASLAQRSRLALTLPLLFALGACSGGGDGGGGWDALSGKEIYSKAGCQACHGADGRGFMGLGSSYAGIKQYWTADKLLTYIADPKAYAANDKRLGKREMAAIADDVPADARKKLVDYVLTLMD